MLETVSLVALEETGAAAGSSVLRVQVLTSLWESLLMGPSVHSVGGEGKRGRLEASWGWGAESSIYIYMGKGGGEGRGRVKTYWCS